MFANPANENEWSITAIEMRDLKQDYPNNDQLLTDNILQKTDLISHLFGSPWLASKFQVRDLTVIADNWFGQYEERDGVGIDRDTETAAEGKLYDYQVVPAGTPFLFKAIVENAEQWELGLLIIGLHQFETEQIPLGGARSRGLGIVRLDIEKMNWFDTENKPEKLIDYLQKQINNDDSIYEDATNHRDQWVRKLSEHLNQQVITNLAQKGST